MKASTKRILSIFASLVGLFYALTAVFNSVTPGWGRLSTLRQEISEKESARDQLQQLVSQARAYLSQQGELERRAQPVDAALPTTPELPELIAILSTLASKNNSFLSQVRFETAEYKPQAGRQTGPAVSKVFVRANIVGTYPNIKAWLRDVEAELRLLDVDTLNIQSTAGEEAPSTADTRMNVEVALTAYWQQ